MISGILFLTWRVFEIVMLIPPVGMLSWFVHGYVDSNQLTPNFILVLFITCVLALAWAVFTTISYLRARHDALFMAFVDLGFMASLIAGVVVLRGIAPANCSNFSSDEFFLQFGPFGYYGVKTGSKYALHVNKNCAVLKTSFAFGIINIFLFFVTFVSFSNDFYLSLQLTVTSSSSLWQFTEIIVTTTKLWSSANIAALAKIPDGRAVEIIATVATTIDQVGEVHKDQAVGETTTSKETITVGFTDDDLGCCVTLGLVGMD